MKKLLTIIASALVSLGAFAEPTITIDSVAEGEVTLALDGIEKDCVLLAAYGAAAGDADSLDGWKHVEVAQELAAGASACTVALPSGWDVTVFHLRFFIVEEMAYDKRLDYIESTDSATIPLGFTASPDMVTRMKFRYVADDGGTFYGYVPSGTDDNNDYRFFSWGGGSSLNLDLPPVNARISKSSFTMNVDHEYEIGNFYVKDLKTGESVMSGNKQNFTRPETVDFTLSEMCLFREGNDRGRVYYIDVYDKDAGDEELRLVHSFRPVLKDDVAGLYDVVADRLCMPVDGGAALTYGEVTGGYNGRIDVASALIRSDSVASISTISAASYDNGALCAEWDAIENVGINAHSASAKTWADLIGGYDMVCYNNDVYPDTTGDFGWNEDGDAYLGQRVNGKKFLYCDDDALWPSLGDEWTIQAFFTPSAGWFQNYSGLCGFHADNVQKRGVCFAQFVDNTIYFSIHKNGGTAYTVQISKDLFTAGEPAQVTMTATPSSIRIYVNGELAGSLDGAIESVCDAPSFFIGNAYGNLAGERMYDGEVHAVRLYNKVLDEDEMTFSYRLDRARFCGVPFAIGVGEDMAISNDRIVSGTLTRDEASVNSDAPVTVYYGATDGGMIEAEWDGSLAVFGSFVTGSATAAVKIYNLPAEAEVIRFMSGGVWSEAIIVSELPSSGEGDPKPVISSASLVDTTTTSLVFSVGIGSIGDGCDSCDIYSVIARGDETPVTNFVATATLETPTVTANITGLKTGVAYSVSFYAVNEKCDEPQFYNDGVALNVWTGLGVVKIGQYQLLDYIESTGKQYIDTGIKPSNSLETEMDITAHAGAAGEQGILGSAWSAQGYFLMYYMNNIRYHSGNDYKDFPVGGLWSLKNRTHLEFSHYGININGTWTEYSPSTEDIKNNLYVFWTGDRGNYPRGKLRVHRLIMRDETGLLRDFYPAYDEVSGLAGLYDLVEGQFYGDLDGSEMFGISADSISENELPAQEGVAPTVYFPLQTSASATSATVGMFLRSHGEGATSVDLKLVVDQKGVLATNELANVDSRGMVYVSAEGLRPSAEYPATLIVDNGLKGGELSFDITLQTADEEYAVGINSRPGFYQATGPHFGAGEGAWEDGFDIMGSASLGIVDAAYAANTGNAGGYCLDASKWIVRYDDGRPAVAGSWYDYVTYGYQTMMYLEAGTYYFGGAIDDNGSVWIDGVEILSFGNASVGNPNDVNKAAYTCGKDGWHELKVYAGNGWGGRGPGGGFKGAAWARSTDDRTNIDNWHFFANTEDDIRFVMFDRDMVTLKDATIAGANSTYVLNYDDQLIGGICTVYAADTYLDSDITKWGAPIATVELTGKSPHTISLATPEDAQYVRFKVDTATRVFESIAYPVVEMKTLDATKPSVGFTAVSKTTHNTATIAGAVNSCGGADTVDIVVSYGYTADDLEYTAVFEDFGVGPIEMMLVNLDPEHTYYASFHATDGATESDETEVFAFDTTSPSTIYGVAPGAIGWSLPGLWQANEAGGLKAAVTNHLTCVRTLETSAFNYHANSTGENPWPVFELDGTEGTRAWTIGNYVAYAGYIFLKEDTTYAFWTSVDDGSSISVDGAPVLGTNGSTSYTPAYTGWHEILATAMDTGGSAGPWDGVCGFAINNAKVIDPGDGSYLRTNPGIRDGRVISSSIKEGKFSASLEFDAWQLPEATVGLYLASGAFDGGDDVAGWETLTYIGALSAEATTYRIEDLELGEIEANNFHFFTKATLDGREYWQWCGDLFAPVDMSRPILQVASFDGSVGDVIRATGKVESVGAGETAKLYFYVAETEDMANANEWDMGDFAAGEAYALDIHTDETEAANYIHPGTIYYVQAKLVADSGAKNVSSVYEVPTSAAATIASCAVSDSNAFATFSGTVGLVGAGTNTTVILFTGPSANALTNTLSQVVTKEGEAFSFTVEYPFVNDTVWYSVMISNDCATTVWTSSVDGSILLRDQYVYYWKPEIHEGAWSDPANWTVEGNPKQATWPNATTCSVVFSGETDDPTKPYHITVDGYYAVINTSYATEELDITFEGIGYGDDVNWRAEHGNNVPSGIYQDGNWGTMAQNVHLTVTNMYFHLHGLRFSESSTVTLDHAYLETWADTWMDASNVTLEMLNTSVFKQASGNYHSQGYNQHIIIDDSVFWGSGGVWNLARDHNWSGGKYVIDIYGTHPYVESVNHLLHCGTSGHNDHDLTMDLVFHVPAGGYETAPLNCVGSTFYSTSDTPLKISVAKDSPARRAGKRITTNLVHSEVGFSYWQEHDKYLMDFSPEDKPVIRYSDDGKNIQVEIPNSGFKVFVK